MTSSKSSAPRSKLRGRLAKIAKRALQLCVLGSAATVVIVCGIVWLVPYSVESLSQRRSGPLVFVDRHGELLRSVPTSEDGWRGREQWVRVDQVSSHAVLTLLASEDQRFYDHPGVDLLGVLRAAWLNLRTGRLAYGGSTITMQLMKLVHSPNQPRSFSNKIKESLLALRAERALSKKTLLEHYLNRAYFGNGAFGIEAAARRYFGKPAASLSVAESTLLAVLPRGPRHYDPIRHLPRALARRNHLFALLVAQGRLDPSEVKRAKDQPVRPRLHATPFVAGHFVDWVRRTLPASIRRSGGVVQTTLELKLQQLLQRRVREHVAGLRHHGINQAGLVVLDTQTSEVLAMVGSTDYQEQQVNIVTRRRHPGSALKPFVYGAAIERGDHPASIAFDVRDVRGSAYQVRWPTQPERGPVRYREALAGSYNLAAVHVLERVGIGRVMHKLQRAGVGQLRGAPDDYGLRLALGSAKVRLLDLASGYGFLVRDGSVLASRGISTVRRHDGSSWSPAPAAERQVFNATTSWLVMDMLSDPVARRPMFGQELPVDLPFAVAVKTGTARGFADTVAVAATRELIVAAWAGNFDGKPTHGITAMRGAAPLVREALLIAGHGQRLTLPPRPSTIHAVTVCPLSGMLPGPHCPHRKRELFVDGHRPKHTCSWHQQLDARTVVRYPSEIEHWAKRQRHYL